MYGKKCLIKGAFRLQKIESMKNDRIKKWKKLQTKKGRNQFQAFLIEGEHLVEEAIKASWDIEAILHSKNISFPFQGETIEVTDAIIAELAQTEAPQGVLAICKLKPEPDSKTAEGIYVLLDGVQDPGNVGTIIRTALAADVAGIVLGDGTADLYNDKVIRSTQGGLFHLPIYRGDLNEWIDFFESVEKPVYGTSLNNAAPYTEVQRNDSFALIVGNEGVGVSDKWLERTTKNLYIPQNIKAESLNVAVATGILLFSLKK